jgi:hypothetical protein
MLYKNDICNKNARALYDFESHEMDQRKHIDYDI